MHKGRTKKKYSKNILMHPITTTNIVLFLPTLAGFHCFLVELPIAAEDLPDEGELLPPNTNLEVSARGRCGILCNDSVLGRSDLQRDLASGCALDKLVDDDVKLGPFANLLARLELLVSRELGGWQQVLLLLEDEPLGSAGLAAILSW